MKTLATFSAWDIAASEEVRNDGYPFLSWEIDESTTIWLLGLESAPEPIVRRPARLFVPIDHKVTLELIRNVEISAGGRAFIDKEGNFHYDSRFGRHT